MFTGLGKGGRNANHAVSVLVFGHRSPQNSRSEHTGRVKIWIISAFLKLMNGIRTVCIEGGSVRLCYSLCWRVQCFLLLDLTQAVAFYWAAGVTRDEIAETLENIEKFVWVTRRSSCEAAHSLPSVVNYTDPLGRNPEVQSNPGSVTAGGKRRLQKPLPRSINARSCVPHSANRQLEWKSNGLRGYARFPCLSEALLPPSPEFISF